MQATILIALQAALALIEWLNRIRPAAQQTGDWTPEVQAQFEKVLLATKTDPKWQPDATD